MIPEGWKLVPVEATEAMTRAAVVYANGSAVYKNVAAEALKIEEGIYAEVYEAMLAAAPQPAPTQPATGKDSLTVGAAPTQPVQALTDERAAFEKAHKHLDLTTSPDPWGRPTYTHMAVHALWDGWQARAALSAAPQPVQAQPEQGAGPVASACGLTECQGKPECARCRHYRETDATPPAQRKPLTDEQIDALWLECAAAVSHMEMQHHYRFASWLKVAVRLTERAHGIAARKP